MAGVPHKASRIGTERVQPPVDRALGRLVARQHGRVSLEQLRKLGLTSSGVRNRVASGRLVRRLQNVYAVGHALLTREAFWMESVLAYGHAVLSHRSAAQLWGLLEGWSRPIHVSVPRRRVRSRKGIRAHATTTLLTRDVDERKASWSPRSPEPCSTWPSLNPSTSSGRPLNRPRSTTGSKGTSWTTCLARATGRRRPPPPSCRRSCLRPPLEAAQIKTRAPLPSACSEKPACPTLSSTSPSPSPTASPSTPTSTGRSTS